MARSQPTEQPRQPLTMMTCLVSILVLTAIVAALWGFWLFFTRVVAPRIPQRFVPNPETTYRGIGDQLRFLELEPLTGNPPRLSVADLQNRVVLLNFWGTWCRPCRDELPHVAALRQRFAGQAAFRLVAISYPPLGQGDDLQSLREETTALLKRLSLDLPTYWDPDNMTRTAVDQLIPDAVEEFSSVALFPLTVLLDRQGAIRAIWLGYRPGVETEIERYVDKVLSEDEG
jgi:cytochrome c biogenesis protein CcmG, thiol:disulfide interchange protein DsbE